MTAAAPAAAKVVTPTAVAKPTTSPAPQDIILEAKGFPTSFDAAKRLLERDVYFDVRTDRYCGCSFDRSLTVDVKSCPMRTALYQDLQDSIEWEHVVPASDFGRQRACWRNPPSGTSGRDHCGRVDKTFRMMEADPHNLIPVIGALNRIRSNHRFGMVASGTEDPVVLGCGFRVARADGGRFIEPPDLVKGKIARIYFYMEDRYGHRIGRSQRRVFDAWNRQFPPDAFEIERDQRLAKAIGVSNPFVALY
ncbi:endonuclease [Polycyclovorans algicola]|uniref:endonuclease n=1 Tax=Polycyclovorans algicola TaxID=616992 RepID=UPI001376F8D1|nr:endonuclease [Polycyclovorans algicola]